MSSNEQDQARAYVLRLRREGRTDEEIRQLMLESGWSEEQLDRLFGVGAPPPPPPPAEPPPAPRESAAPTRRPGAASRPRPQPGAGPAPRPFGVSFLVVLCDIGALFGLAGSVMALLGVGLMAGRGGDVGASGLMMLLVFVFMAIYGGILVVGHFLWNGFNWARIAFMVLLALWALMAIRGLFGGIDIGTVLTIAVNVLFILILAGRGAREYCTR